MSDPLNASAIDLDALRRLGDDLDGRAPTGDDPSSLWANRKLGYRLVNPNNRRTFKVIVVGTGLAGAGAAAALGELGYQVESFTFHDSLRRAHSVAAQGGINAARARKVDNDSVERMVLDTVRGGDFRGREADVYRLAEESGRVIDHPDAIGAPFAREYGGSLRTRSFGGVQVSRTYYARGQTGQQLQVAASQALLRQVAAGSVTLHTRHEMLDLVVVDGRAQGVVVRDLVSGEVRAVTGHAVVLCTGGYGNVYYHSTLAKNSNPTAAWRAHKRGAYFASPSFMQFHPTALPVNAPWQTKTTLMSESLRNDGRIWVPAKAGDTRAPETIPEDERDYYLERKYPAFGNLAPRDVSSRAAREQLETSAPRSPACSSAARSATTTTAPTASGPTRCCRRRSTGGSPSPTPCPTTSLRCSAPPHSIRTILRFGRSSTRSGRAWNGCAPSTARIRPAGSIGASER